MLVLTRLLAAPRELVFQVWTQPEHLARWWGPKHFHLPFCQVDFREGGVYKFCMRAPDGSNHWVWGAYREILAPERLVFTWHRTQEPEEVNPWGVTVVTITLTEQAGNTLLTLHQATFQKIEERDAHRGGWTECLDRLASYVSHHYSAAFSS